MKKQMESEQIWNAMLNHVYRDGVLLSYDQARESLWSRLRREFQDELDFYQTIVLQLNRELGDDEEY